jgi:nicotinamidase-related amidase
LLRGINHAQRPTNVGFDVVTLKDCTATLSQEAQDMALTHNFGMFSHPMNHDEFVKLLA